MASIHYQMRVKIYCLYLLLRTVLDLPCIGIEIRGAKGTYSALENEM